MKISAEVADAILETSKGEEFEGYTVVEISDWVDDGKYSYMEIIFKYQDKHYRLNRSRSGSYHTDYYWDTEDQNEFECAEVKPVEVTKIVWK